MTLKEFYTLAKKYEKGICSDEEKILFEQFYDQFKDDGIKWDIKDDHYKKEIRNNMFDKIDSHINKKRTPSIIKFNYFFLKVAVVMLMAFGVVLMIYSNQEESLESNPLLAENIIKENPNGVKTRITLPDGSLVWLNSGSTISYAPKFSGETRNVELQGEAFFEVKRDESKPFVVFTHNVETKVLGTSFNVKAFDEENVSITVASGKVRVSSSDNGQLKKSSIDLVVNQQATFDLSTGNINVNKIDANRYISWTQGRLIFDEVSIDKAAQIIERWYGVEVKFETQEIRNCRIKNEYNNENLVNVLEGIKFILNIDYEIKNDKKVILKGKGCST